VAFSISVAPARNFFTKLAWGHLSATPFSLGAWALLEPAGAQNHAPQLCWINNDQLACVWMAGGQEGTSGMSIYGSLLERGKPRWSKPKLLSQHPDKSEQNPLLYASEDGRLHLIHTGQLARDPNDTSWRDQGSAFSMQWTAKLYHQSTAGWGKRWTRSEPLFDESAFCRNPPMKTSSGKWILPIYRSLEAEGAFGHDYSQVAWLDPSLSRIQSVAEVEQSRGRVHGSIVLSGDGTSLLQFFRSRLADCIYRSVGSLDGMQWTVPEPINLPNNNSSIQALRLKSGLLAIVFNRFSLPIDAEEDLAWGKARWPSTRWPLSIALSEDDGLNWPWVRDIDTGDGFSGSANWFLNGQLAYPSIVEGLPGELHIAYSWGNRAAIRYVMINEHNVLGSQI
jgi:predicted neuraminidase